MRCGADGRAQCDQSIAMHAATFTAIATHTTRVMRVGIELTCFEGNAHTEAAHVTLFNFPKTIDGAPGIEPLLTDANVLALHIGAGNPVLTLQVNHTDKTHEIVLVRLGAPLAFHTHADVAQPGARIVVRQRVEPGTIVYHEAAAAVLELDKGRLHIVRATTAPEGFTKRVVDVAGEYVWAGRPGTLYSNADGPWALVGAAPRAAGIRDTRHGVVLYELPTQCALVYVGDSDEALLKEPPRPLFAGSIHAGQGIAPPSRHALTLVSNHAASHVLVIAPKTQARDIPAINVYMYTMQPTQTTAPALAWSCNIDFADIAARVPQSLPSSYELVSAFVGYGSPTQPHAVVWIGAPAERMLLVVTPTGARYETTLIGSCVEPGRTPVRSARARSIAHNDAQYAAVLLLARPALFADGAIAVIAVDQTTRGHSRFMAVNTRAPPTTQTALVWSQPFDAPLTASAVAWGGDHVLALTTDTETVALFDAAPYARALSNTRAPPLRR